MIYRRPAVQEYMGSGYGRLGSGHSEPILQSQLYRFADKVAFVTV